jgi:hypothetical protein
MGKLKLLWAAHKLPIILGGIVLAIGLFFGAKALYDRSIIKAHDNKREAQIAKDDRKADAKAAVERRADDARITTETQELKEVVREAAPVDRRAAYYACLAKLQDARARNQPPPDC